MIRVSCLIWRESYRLPALSRRFATDRTGQKPTLAGISRLRTTGGLLIAGSSRLSWNKSAGCHAFLQ